MTAQRRLLARVVPLLVVRAIVLLVPTVSTLLAVASVGRIVSTGAPNCGITAVILVVIASSSMVVARLVMRVPIAHGRATATASTGVAGVVILVMVGWALVVVTASALRVRVVPRVPAVVVSLLRGVSISITAAALLGALVRVSARHLLVVAWLPPIHA